jgi:soluble lytic murein transglycosylase-like protein
MNNAVLVASRTYAALKSTLAIVGLAVVAALLMLPVQRESMLSQFPAFAVALFADSFTAASTTAAGSIQPTAVESAQEREQRLVAEFIAKRYRVAEQAVAGYVSMAYRAGEEQKVDPLLILAVMAIESRYNPVAESVMGAKGLMQVIPKFHLDKLLDHGGEHALLVPEVNIQVGAQILREYYRRLGDVEASLQMYAGAFDEPTAQYANKVLAEKARLEALRQKAKKQQTV